MDYFLTHDFFGRRDDDDVARRWIDYVLAATNEADLASFVAAWTYAGYHSSDDEYLDALEALFVRFAPSLTTICKYVGLNYPAAQDDRRAFEFGALRAIVERFYAYLATDYYSTAMCDAVLRCET